MRTRTPALLLVVVATLALGGGVAAAAAPTEGAAAGCADRPWPGCTRTAESNPGCTSDHRPDAGYRYTENHWGSDSCHKCQRSAAGLQGGYYTYCQRVSLHQASLFLKRR